MSEMKRKLIGQVGVDAGQILICDPCYIERQWKNGVDALEYADLNSREPNRPEGYPFDYGGTCAASCNDQQGGQLNYKAGHAGAGVAVSSGVGDGMYPVYAEYSDEGEWGERVARVTIDFGLIESGGD